MPINIISDSVYVVNAVLTLETAKILSSLVQYLKFWWKYKIVFWCVSIPSIFNVLEHIHLYLNLWLREMQLLIQPLEIMVFLSQNSIVSAKNFHQLYHVPASTLWQKFKLTRTEARDIVLQCGRCVEFINAPSVGINPRRLWPLDVWQMDVTHIPAFGKLQYVHVSIDTSSGALHASPLTGEKAVHVITHCLEASP